MTQFHKKKFKIKTSQSSDVKYVNNYDDIFRMPCPDCTAGTVTESRGDRGTYYYSCDTCSGTGKVRRTNG